MSDNEIIQGLWVGNRLSTLEKLSIVSFLRNGHDYHLYVYGEVEGVPKGVTLMQAESIIPRERIFQYSDRETYAAFANLFRYKLLLGKGGFWADTDVVCLRPFNFEMNYVFAQEKNENGIYDINNNVIKAPQGCRVMQFCYSVSAAKDPHYIKWGETGPKLLNEAVHRFEMSGYAVSYVTFNPITWWEWNNLISNDSCTQRHVDSLIATDVYAVHFWNEMWRMTKTDKNQSYHADCLYEKLRKRYLSDS